MPHVPTMREAGEARRREIALLVRHFWAEGMPDASRQVQRAFATVMAERACGGAWRRSITPDFAPAPTESKLDSEIKN
jgi:hypothetical protein